MMHVSENVCFIGCGVLAPDIKYIAQKSNLSFRQKYLPGGLHDRPDELKSRLQAAIDEVSKDETIHRIIVGYGLCGKGAVGIYARRIPLVFPKVHDCISLFLGSDQAYRREFKKFPGTFYISAGWYAEQARPKKNKPEQVWVGSHAMGCKEITDRYGKKSGQEIINFLNSWQDNYQRAAFIDTGSGKTERPAKHAREMAEKYNWVFQRIKGNLSLMTQLVTSTKSNDRILVVPPNHITTYSAVENGLSTAQVVNEDTAEKSSTRYLVLDPSEKKDPSITYGLGVDAGGTYTDAAIYNFMTRRLHSKNKALTTKWDFTIGIEKALSSLDKTLLTKVELVSVSTTLATNAIVENEGQAAGLILMPGLGQNADKGITHTPLALVKGRLTIQGIEKEPVDPDEIRRMAIQMIERYGVSGFAVSGYAGAANPTHELTVKRIIREETGMPVTCGHELSSMLNFMVRAQTAVLNARIIHRMIKFFRELETVLIRFDINAPVMVVKGDGTLMSAAMAQERPVETILSGPAASVAGAKLLTGIEDAVVVDIGGTTTDTADLSNGLVDVCDSGARVGGIPTHVKALNMRTIGLGGDSLIRWFKDELQIGPRRVAPVVWADTRGAGGLSEALSFMESKLKRNLSMTPSYTLLVAMEGEIPFTPTPEEASIYKTLRQRAYSLEELAQSVDMISAQMLPFERLENYGLVQRCGLTPTDIFHIKGLFTKWHPDAARRMVKLLASQSAMAPDAFVERVLDQFEKKLARELLRKQFAQNIPLEPEAESTLSDHLMDCMLSGGPERYTIKASLSYPVIGIGAPTHFFLPNAGKRLNAKVIIPDDADVANALGAITSHIRIRQTITIRPYDTGGFMVDGIGKSRRFLNIDEAEDWAVENLKTSVQKMGHFAGTSRKTVKMKIQDRIVTVGHETSVFLDRTIQATLSGNPDIAWKKAMAG